MRVFLFLFLCFILLPFLELTLLFKLSAHLGFANVVLLAVVTAIAGASLAKWQGREAWLNLQKTLQQGQIPKRELWDAGLILFAGIVLLTPGLISDIFGLLLLLPFFRTIFIAVLKKIFANVKWQKQTSSNFHFNATMNPGSKASSSDDVIIEGQAEEVRDYRQLNEKK